MFLCLFITVFINVYEETKMRVLKRMFKFTTTIFFQYKFHVLIKTLMYYLFNHFLRLVEKYCGNNYRHQIN